MRRRVPQSLKAELEWRNAVVAGLDTPGPAPPWIQELEQSRLGMTRREFLMTLQGYPVRLTQDEFLARLERATGAAPRASARPSIRTLLDDPAARNKYVKSLRSSPPSRQSPRHSTEAHDHTARSQFMPRDNLIRGMMRLPVARDGRVTQLRSATGDSNILEGHFAVFSQWTEIDSMWEGNFMEQIAPGAFSKTFRESRAAIKVLFQHGRDPQIGDKPLGTIDELDEDEIGAHYAVPLFQTSYNAELIPALRAGAFGASFRFSVVKESVDNAPAKSTWNPAGIPQRTITEARVFEFGPVTFPAYANATAGMRSLTDHFDRAA